MKPRVTMKEIADRLGISVSAVSLALSNKEGVAEMLREKVFLVAEEMGYSARRRVAAEARDIGFTIHLDRDEELRNSYYTDVQLEAQREAEKHGFHLIVNFISRQEVGRGVMPFCFEKNICGVLLAGSFPQEYVQNLQARKVPIVSLGNECGDPPVTCVLCDDLGGSLNAVQYLIGMGHRRIAFVGDAPIYSSSQSRKRGYLLALHEAGIPFDPDLCLDGVSGEKEDVGYRLTRQLIEQQRGRLDAIFCATDDEAVGCLKALAECSLSVPEDVSVMGFDDKFSSQYLSVPLTTMHIHSLRMGRVAMRRLVSLIEDGGAAVGESMLKTVVPVSLVERASVAPRQHPHAPLAHRSVSEASASRHRR